MRIVTGQRVKLNFSQLHESGRAFMIVPEMFSRYASAVGFPGVGPSAASREGRADRVLIILYKNLRDF